MHGFLLLADFAEPRHGNGIGEGMQRFLEGNREEIVAVLAVLEDLRSLPERQSHIVIERPVLDAGRFHLFAQFGAGPEDEFEIEGDSEAAEWQVRFLRRPVAHGVAVLLEPIEAALLAVLAFREAIPVFLSAVTPAGLQFVLADGRKSADRVQKPVEIVQESHPVRQVDEDVERVPSVAHGLDDGLPHRVTGRHRRFAAVEQRGLEIGAGRQDDIGPARGLGLLDVQHDYELELLHDLLDLVRIQHVPQRIAVIDEHGLRLVLEPEPLRFHQRLGIQLTGVETDGEPLEKMGRIRRVLEFRLRVQLVRFGFELAVLAGADEETARIERYAEMATGYVDVAHQHVEELIGHVVEQAVGV